MGTVVQAKITKVEAEFDNINLGHKFWFSIVIQRADECQLRWYEKTDYPYIPDSTRWDPQLKITLGRKGMPANQWWDMYKNVEDSDIFKPWRDAQERKRASTAFQIIDIPATRVGKVPHKRYLDFRIIVSSGTNERFCEARQELEWDGEKAVKQSFVITRNNVVSRSPHIL